MKVIQFEKSYRIHLSPGEFESLKSIADLGLQWLGDDDEMLETIMVTSSPAHNRALTKFAEHGRTLDVDVLLAVDEDRRK